MTQFTKIYLICINSGYRIYLFPLFLLILLFFTNTSVAQEINFGQYGDYTVSIENVSLGDFEFEGPIISDGGTYQVELIDSYVLSIIGVKYLDVGVTITGDGVLVNTDPNCTEPAQCSIPFTLNSAYANRGQNNIADAVIIPVSANNANTRFPVLARQQQPPGPPPPPPTEAFDQAQVEESAYLYLYGEISVGNVNAGLYTGTINITVEYE